MINKLNCFHCDWIGSRLELLHGFNGVKCPKCKKHIPQDAEGWISVNNGLPEEVGWYQIKTTYGQFEAPFVNNSRQELVWLIPDTSIITHWKNK